MTALWCPSQWHEPRKVRVDREYYEIEENVTSHQPGDKEPHKSRIAQLAEGKIPQHFSCLSISETDYQKTDAERDVNLLLTGKKISQKSINTIIRQPTRVTLEK